jgi:hypothetical protein
LVYFFVYLLNISMTAITGLSDLVDLAVGIIEIKAGACLGGLNGEENNTVATLGGSASGGDTNTTGGSSTAVASGGAGGTSPNGGTGVGGGAKTEEDGVAGAAGKVVFTYLVAGGSTYSNTATGGILGGGNAAPSLVESNTATGGILGGGNAAPSLVKSNTPTGGILGGGTTINALILSVNTISGPNSPTNYVNDATIGTLDWANLGNVVYSDNTYSTVGDGASVQGTSKYLLVSGFGFSIPIDATVTGITVSLESKSLSNDAFVNHYRARIVKAGSIGSTDKTVTWSDTENTQNLGGSSDLWGETWTISDINDPTTGFAIAVTLTDAGSPNSIAYIDRITMTVSYSGGSVDFSSQMFMMFM